MWQSRRSRPLLMHASSFLPVDLPFPPIYSKVNPADTPIITLALTSEDYAVDRRWKILLIPVLALKLAQVAGVGLVSISGGQRPAVRVQVNPNGTGSIWHELEDVRIAQWPLRM